MKTVWAISAFLLMGVAVASAQDAGKISGYMFGDYHYIVANHEKDLEGENGFWFRRIYLGYDKSLNESFDVKLRFEMSNAGDFSSKSSMTPFVKDAYLKWKKGRNSTLLGVSGTPTWGLVEEVWGYRAVEKTPLDLQKMGSSRDLGLAFKGAFDAAKKFKYHAMVGNGASTGSENNADKKVMASVSGEFVKGFVVEGYVDYDSRPGDDNRVTLQGFAAYKMENYRIGVQFATQTRETDSSDADLALASVFGAVKINDKVWAFARADKTLDPNPEGAKIAYIPFDNTAESTFIVAGLDFRPMDKVQLMPNVEVVLYSENDAGVTPDTDIIPRFTFYYKF